MWARWKTWVERLRLEVTALYWAYRDPRTPWYAKAMALAVVAYAVSPIDLIPDPIPVLGYLDDLVLVPLGVLLAIRLVPVEVMTECRDRSRSVDPELFRCRRVAAVVVVIIWVAFAYGLTHMALGLWASAKCPQ